MRQDGQGTSCPTRQEGTSHRSLEDLRVGKPLSPQFSQPRPHTSLCSPQTQPFSSSSVLTRGLWGLIWQSTSPCTPGMASMDEYSSSSRHCMVRSGQRPGRWGPDWSPRSGCRVLGGWGLAGTPAPRPRGMYPRPHIPKSNQQTPAGIAGSDHLECGYAGVGADLQVDVPRVGWAPASHRRVHIDIHSLLACGAIGASRPSCAGWDPSSDGGWARERAVPCDSRKYSCLLAPVGIAHVRPGPPAPPRPPRCPKLSPPHCLTAHAISARPRSCQRSWPAPAGWTAGCPCPWAG